MHNCLYHVSCFYFLVCSMCKAYFAISVDNLSDLSGWSSFSLVQRILSFFMLYHA